MLLACIVSLQTDTTDIQMISAVPLSDTNKFMLQCNFAIGSDARGCMVIIISGCGNMTKNLTRLNNRLHIMITLTLNVSQALNCFTGLFGYDIESDGSVGTLSVLGEIAINYGSREVHFSSARPFSACGAHTRMRNTLSACGRLSPHADSFLEKCTFLPHDPFPHAELTPACGTVISACGDLTPHAEHALRMRNGALRMRKIVSACGLFSACG